MYDEKRLIVLGIPLEDAISICDAMRREGKLEEYIQAQEQEYRNRCARYVKEVMD